MRSNSEPRRHENGNRKILASVGEDQKVRLSDMASGKHRELLGGHWEAVYGVAISMDGRTVACGGGDTLIRVWEISQESKRGVR
jgi:WD40 repeat protein